jgi:hypothetical protein
MVDWERGGIRWRQGQFLTEDAAVNLKLVAPEDKGLEIPIVISHDCDISNTPEVERYVEIIVGTRIEAVDGNCTHSKNPRKLHLSAKHGDTDVCLELWATGKQLILKQELLAFEPNSEFTIPGKELLTLQRWLAARYHRSAFPDEFDRRLKQTGLYKALVKILKPLGHHIIAALFDIDNGVNFERDADEVYTLVIYLLYSTENDPLEAERMTQEAAQSISEAFEKLCFDADNKTWRNIELADCQAIADEGITYAQSQTLKKWNIDYLSLRDDPVQLLLSS